VEERGEEVPGLPEEATGGDKVPEAQDLNLPTEEKDDSDYTPKETARESAQKAFNKLRADKSDNGDQNTTDPKSPEVAKRGPGRPRKEAPLEAPARLEAAEKEAFKTYPPEMQKAIHRTIQQMERKFTETQTEYQRGIQETASIREALMPVAQDWGARGITASQGIAMLCSAQARLTNPETSTETFIKIGKDLGIDFDDLADIVRGEKVIGDRGNDISQHPQFQALQAELNDVRSYQQQLQQRDLEGAVAPIVSEMEAVRQEVDASGAYRYPELHDEAFLDSVKPLVFELVKAVPGLGDGEALLRAYHTVKGTTGNFNPPSSTRLPAQQQTIQQRAASAAVTVRGRTAPITGSGGMVGDIPPEALKDPKASAQWALNMLRRG